MLFIIPSVSAQTVWNFHGIVVDEDNNTLLPSPTVTIDGNAIAVANGVFDINVVNELDIDIQISQPTYGTRTWTFGVDKDDGNLIRVLPLLLENDGTSITFEMRTADGNALLTDGNISIIHTDLDTNYVSGRFVIGSNSQFTAFLSPFDQNHL